MESDIRLGGYAFAVTYLCLDHYGFGLGLLIAVAVIIAINWLPTAEKLVRQRRG